MNFSNQLKKRARSERAAALITVFWLIAVLSLLIFTTVRVLRNDVRLTISQKKAFRATQLAEMGIAVGVNPSTKEIDYLLLNRQISDDEHFNVKIRGEGGKFNINAILQQAGEGDTLLEDIFAQWLSGTDEAFAEREFRDLASALVDALRDWVDPDDLAGLNGAENEYYFELGYENYPFNRPFYSLDEILLVRGMDQVIAAKRNWRDFFTIYSGGKLDMNEADAEAIALATGADIESAQELVELRWGPDKIDDTEDDYKFNSLAEVFSILGVLEDPILQSRLTLNDNTKRIESIGTVGDFRKKIEIVIRTQGRTPQILSREEVPLFD
ncbi:MAG: type II secretion system protein GspK [Verrucomicrobia bacterium]|nr:type II secretion system protein GspK [Verrucomicrobiota bacterium]